MSPLLPAIPIPRRAKRQAAAAQPTSTSIGSLEIGRFLAASLVVMTHFWPDMSRFAADPAHTRLSNVHLPGAFAVQYFFVLSGFVMMIAHFNDFGRLSAVPKFWWRRICRIYPMYWIGLLICIYYLYGFLTPSYSLELFSLSPTRVSDMVGPAWSLRYEMAFYAMFGLCLLPYAGRFILFAWVYAVFAVWAPQYISAILPVLIQDRLGSFAYWHGGDFLAPFEFYFFAGLLCGWVYKRYQVKNWLSFLAVAAGIAGFWQYWKILDGGHGFGSPPVAPITGLFFGLIILGLASLERSGTVRLGIQARRLGMLSYPLYILHDPIMCIMNNQFGNVLRIPPAGMWIFSISLLCSVYLLCALITFFIDQPVQKLLRNINIPSARQPGHRKVPAVSSANSTALAAGRASRLEPAGNEP